MIVRYELDLSQVDPHGKLTPKEAAMFSNAEKQPVIFDEDSPALTKEMAAAFRQARQKKPYSDSKSVQTE